LLLNKVSWLERLALDKQKAREQPLEPYRENVLHRIASVGSNSLWGLPVNHQRSWRSPRGEVAPLGMAIAIKYVFRISLSRFISGTKYWDDL
jgi:2-polyprenyl-6-methoxyphenol hydroxylase-like FAD-dependent oxidoreductase